MLDQALIRNQVILAAGEAGPLVEAAVRRIVEEAERYARERASIPAGAPSDVVAAAVAATQAARGILRDALRPTP